MPIIRYDDQCYPVDSNETVLDTLLNHGVDFPHSCKIGTCQSCLVKLVDGKISTDAQKGLKPTLASQQYFLACQCKPDSNMVIALPDKNDTAVASSIISMTQLNHNVVRVELALDQPNEFKAGQYINLVTHKNLIRSYSIANISKQSIELHIKLMPNGLMTHWLINEASLGTPVFIRGPMGDCFYHNPECNSFPIVLAGTGTGLAPLIGIATDALASNHDGKIILIHGGVDESDLYLHDALTKLQETYPNFYYTPCVLNQSGTVKESSIDDVLVKQINTIANEVRLFVCGPEETTNKMKMKAFLAGVPSASIYSDAFITAHI